MRRLPLSTDNPSDHLKLTPSTGPGGALRTERKRGLGTLWVEELAMLLLGLTNRLEDWLQWDLVLARA